MSEDSYEESDGVPLSSIGQTVGIFALVGVGIGLTGGVAMSQLGSGGAIISGILLLVILTITFLLGPVVGVITGLRIGELRDRTSKSYLAGLIGSVAGYFAMMLIVLLILSTVMAVVMGDGGSGSTAAQSTASTTTSSSSSSGGLPIGEYLVPIIAVAIPTGLTGIGGVFFGGSSQTTTAGGSIDLPWKYVGIGIVALAVLASAVLVVPGLLTPSPQQLEVTGDASTTQTTLYAEGTVENPTGNEISTTLSVELVIDDEVVTTTNEDITVPANDESVLRIQVATVDGMTNQEIRAVSNGNYQFRYIIEGETVETYEP